MTEMEHLTEESKNNKHHDLKEKAEKFKQKTLEMEEQVTQNLNNFISVTAENLDRAADKMHETAEFFRQRNMTTLKEDFSHTVQKKPMHALGGAMLLGFLIGKIIFR